MIASHAKCKEKAALAFEGLVVWISKVWGEMGTLVLVYWGHIFLLFFCKASPYGGLYTVWKT